ncbi:MAG: ATPase [Desulfatiglandales bacterium]
MVNLLSGSVTLLVIGMVSLALAAEGGASHGPSEWADLLYRILNFGLMVVILVLVLRKSAIKSFFANRREELERRLVTLQKEKEEAERGYRELEAKLKEMEKSKGEIIEEFRREGEIEKEKIISKARERANYMLSQAEATIQRELQSAKERLMAEVMAMAAKKAEELLRKNIKDKDQDNLIEDFIQKVGRLH